MASFSLPLAASSVLQQSARRLRPIGAAAAIVALAPSAATAQTYGFATLPPGTLNHTTASAVAKVLKEKGNLNVLVQPTAGDQVIVPMVDRGEAEVGISNSMEVHDGLAKGQKNLRIIAAAHALRVGFFVRRIRRSRRSPTSRASGCPTASRRCGRSSRPYGPCWRRPA
jgi:hypothetical protein